MLEGATVWVRSFAVVWRRVKRRDTPSDEPARRVCALRGLPRRHELASHTADVSFGALLELLGSTQPREGGRSRSAMPCGSPRRPRSASSIVQWRSGRGRSSSRAHPPATNETLNVKPPSMSNFDDDRSTRSWYDLRVVCALCILLSANGDVRDRHGAPRRSSAALTGSHSAETLTDSTR